MADEGSKVREFRQVFNEFCLKGGQRQEAETSKEVKG